MLAEATLEAPADQRPILGGRRGHHSEHLGHLLAVMQFCRAPIRTRHGERSIDPPTAHLGRCWRASPTPKFRWSPWSISASSARSRPDRVTITPTYTGCPATLVIERDIRAALDAAGFRDVAIETTLSPPWTTDWISESGQGEAPRLRHRAAAARRAERAVECPQCGSTQTEEISRFGSTPCKAQWRCRACLEPFDLFKCH